MEKIKMKPIQVFLTEEEHKQLKDFCKSNKMSQYIRYLIKKEFKYYQEVKEQMEAEEDERL